MPSLEAREARERLSQYSVHVLVAPPASLLARGRRLAVFGARRLCEKDWRPPPVLRRPRRGRLAGVEAVCGRLPIHVGDRPCPDRGEDERVEPVHLVRRADRDRGALVDSLEQAGRGGKERSGELLHTHNVVGHGSGAGTAFKVQGQVHVGGRGSVCPEGCRGCVSVSQSVLHAS